MDAPAPSGQRLEAPGGGLRAHAAQPLREGPRQGPGPAREQARALRAQPEATQQQAAAGLELAQARQRLEANAIGRGRQHPSHQGRQQLPGEGPAQPAREKGLQGFTGIVSRRDQGFRQQPQLVAEAESRRAKEAGEGGRAGVPPSAPAQPARAPGSGGAPGRRCGIPGAPGARAPASPVRPAGPARPASAPNRLLSRWPPRPRPRGRAAADTRPRGGPRCRRQGR